jgi:hypothetical protein
MIPLGSNRAQQQAWPVIFARVAAEDRMQGIS